MLTTDKYILYTSIYSIYIVLYIYILFITLYITIRTNASKYIAHHGYSGYNKIYMLLILSFQYCAQTNLITLWKYYFLEVLFLQFSRINVRPVNCFPRNMRSYSNLISVFYGYCHSSQLNYALRFASHIPAAIVKFHSSNSCGWTT